MEADPERSEDLIVPVMDVLVVWLWLLFASDSCPVLVLDTDTKVVVEVAPPPVAPVL